MRLALATAVLAVLLGLPVDVRAATPSPQPTAVSTVVVQVSGTVQLPNGAASCAGLTYTAVVHATERDPATGQPRTVTRKIRTGPVTTSCTYAFGIEPNEYASLGTPQIGVTVSGTITMPVAVTGNAVSTIAPNTGRAVVPAVKLAP